MMLIIGLKSLPHELVMHNDLGDLGRWLKGPKSALWRVIPRIYIPRVSPRL